jgi:hypothetical protein
MKRWVSAILAGALSAAILILASRSNWERPVLFPDAFLNIAEAKAPTNGTGRELKNTSGQRADTEPPAATSPEYLAELINRSNTGYTIASFPFLTGATSIPLDIESIRSEPENGLYAFTCKTYLHSAVTLGDPRIPQLDPGKSTTGMNGIAVPMSSNFALRLAKASLLATYLLNWELSNANRLFALHPIHLFAPIPAFDTNSNLFPLSSFDKFLQRYCGEDAIPSKFLNGHAEVQAGTRPTLSDSSDGHCNLTHLLLEESQH